MLSLLEGLEPVGEGSDSEEAEVDRLWAAVSSMREIGLVVVRERLEVWKAEELASEGNGKAEETTPGSLGV